MATDQAQFPAETSSQDQGEALLREADEHINTARAGKAVARASRARFDAVETEWFGEVKRLGLWRYGPYADWLDYMLQRWGIKKSVAWKIIYQDEFIRDATQALYGDRPDAARLYCTSEDARDPGASGRPAAIKYAVHFRNKVKADRDVASMTDDELQQCFARGIGYVRFYDDDEYDAENTDSVAILHVDADDDEDAPAAPGSPPVIADSGKSKVVPIIAAPSRRPRKRGSHAQAAASSAEQTPEQKKDARRRTNFDLAVASADWFNAMAALRKATDDLGGISNYKAMFELLIAQEKCEGKRGALASLLTDMRGWYPDDISEAYRAVAEQNENNA